MPGNHLQSTGWLLSTLLLVCPVTQAQDDGSCCTASLEEPVAGSRVSGVKNLRGWAVSDVPGAVVDRIELWVDGEYVSNVPIGGLREDVAAAFPDRADAAQSGYSMAFNFGDLGPGEHEVSTRTCIDDSLSISCEVQSAAFTVVTFGEAFLSASAGPDFGDSTASVNSLNGELGITGVRAPNGNTYDVKLNWRTASQGFEIEQIDEAPRFEPRACLTQPAATFGQTDTDIQLNNGAVLINSRGEFWSPEQDITLFQTRGGGWKALIGELDFSMAERLQDIRLSREPDSCDEVFGEPVNGFTLGAYKDLLFTEPDTGDTRFVTSVGPACPIDYGELLLYEDIVLNAFWIDIASGEQCSVVWIAN